MPNETEYRETMQDIRNLKHHIEGEYPARRERALVVTKLDEAILWLTALMDTDADADDGIEL